MSGESVGAQTPAFPLPQLTGTWLRARQLIAAWGLADDLSGTHIRLDAGRTLAGTAMFVDEMVRSILVERRAELLVVSLAGPELSSLFRSAAAYYNVTGRLSLYSGPVPADQRM